MYSGPDGNEAWRTLGNAIEPEPYGHHHWAWWAVQDAAGQWIDFNVPPMV
jgi:hypothetical protein